MIRAADAARLPSAQLTEDDLKIVNKLDEELDTGIRKSMRRNGFDFQTNNTNSAAMFEVVQRLQDAGYVVQCQPILKQPRIQGGMVTHEGYSLSVAPGRDALEAAKSLLQ